MKLELFLCRGANVNQFGHGITKLGYCLQKGVLSDRLLANDDLPEIRYLSSRKRDNTHGFQ